MSSGALWRTRAAVSRWMSAWRAKASLRCSSPETWARIRSSIWRVVGGEERQVRARRRRTPAGSADRAAVRIGMFWRFGSDDDSRPVDGDGLVEGRVEPAVGGDQGRQRLDVGRAELRVDPPLEELVDHRVGRPELLEHRGVGREAGLRPLALRQVQLEEQDLLELLRAAEVELVADVDVDLLLEPRRSRPRTRDRGRRAPRGRARRRPPPSGRGPG